MQRFTTVAVQVDPGIQKTVVKCHPNTVFLEVRTKSSEQGVIDLLLMEPEHADHATDTSERVVIAVPEDGLYEPVDSMMYVGHAVLRDVVHAVMVEVPTVELEDHDTDESGPTNS